MIKNGKIFGKINIFDFIVIILAILLVVASIGVFGLKNLKQLNGDKAHGYGITYQITLESVRKETINAMKTGDEIYMAGSKEHVGVIEDISSKNAVAVMETLSGNVVSAPVEDRYNVVITVSAPVKRIGDGDIWLSGKDRLLEGQGMNFLTQKNKCYGITKNIEFLKDFGEIDGSFANFRETYYKERIKK